MHTSANLCSETAKQESSPTETRPGTESEKRLCKRPQHTASHLVGRVLSSPAILFNVDHGHSRSQMSDARSYHKKYLRTEFINGIVMLSEAKHLWSMSIRDRYKIDLRFFAALRMTLSPGCSHNLTVFGIFAPSTHS